jgi:flagellar basal-body rod protein FlgF
MNNSFTPSASSLQALALQYRAIAHNMANVNTTGFKRDVNTFTEKLMQRMGAISGEPLVNEVQGRNAIDFSQGSIHHTGRKLDMAIEGEGFFVIETPDGDRYTRNGTFRTNENGKLVDFRGRTVAGEGGPITLPDRYALSQVAVAQDGTITAGGREVGKLKVVGFEDNRDLAPIGDGCYRVTDEDIQPEEIESPVVHQGYSEKSNVNMVEELVDLMQVSRMYEANTKMMKKQDERLRTLMQAAM